ncbi:uncharacterized protein LOC126734266 [Anthonomus grandis grandis]|uniref:uncharacterized protein LOC126734266 n=1 Tax=Anthonomus grandis grandis TaxID=2921223 RepID=UPI0021663D8D|nr:uncharacterized protein LOC126734266 [Anthonomus grandis grandis]
MKAYYQLPDNSSYYNMPSLATLDAHRKKRSTSRWLAYDFLEQILKRNNYPDGKACLLKSICEVASIKLEERAGLLAEIVHTILTPSSTKDDIRDHSDNEYHAAEKLGQEDGKCGQLFPECPIDPIGQYSKLMTVGKYFV